MTTGVIVLARLDSSRLPGKALIDLAGRPLLGRVLERVRRIAAADRVAVATSCRPIDDPIANFAQQEEMEVFRGATNDVLDRCLSCAREKGFDQVVRISGDSPFLPPEVADELIRHHVQDPGVDLTTNIFPRSYPPGASVEVISISALEMISGRADDVEDREHVTRYVYRNPDSFRIRNVAAPEGKYTGVRLTVDISDDLDRSSWIIERLPTPPCAATLDDVVELAHQWQNEHRTSGKKEATRENHPN